MTGGSRGRPQIPGRSGGVAGGADATGRSSFSSGWISGSKTACSDGCGGGVAGEEDGSTFSNMLAMSPSSTPYVLKATTFNSEPKSSCTHALSLVSATYESPALAEVGLPLSMTFSMGKPPRAVVPVAVQPAGDSKISSPSAHGGDDGGRTPQHYGNRYGRFIIPVTTTVTVSIMLRCTETCRITTLLVQAMQRTKACV